MQPSSGSTLVLKMSNFISGHSSAPTRGGQHGSSSSASQSTSAASESSMPSPVAEMPALPATLKLIENAAGDDIIRLDMRQLRNRTIQRRDVCKDSTWVRQLCQLTGSAAKPSLDTAGSDRMNECGWCVQFRRTLQQAEEMAVSRVGGTLFCGRNTESRPSATGAPVGAATEPYNGSIPFTCRPLLFHEDCLRSLVWLVSV